MSKPTEPLPEAVLDRIVASTLELSPSLRSVFLASLGTRTHASAVRVLFNSLSFPDDNRVFDVRSASDLTPNNAVTRVIANSERYGRAVRTIVIHKPECALAVQEQCDEWYNENLSVWRPVHASHLDSLLSACPALEELIWESSVPPPDGICEILSSRNARLSTLSFAPQRSPYPSSHNSTRSSLPKWDAPSLPLLSSLHVTTLHLARLSQAGSRALQGLFSTMGEYSSLEDVEIDFVWLDDSLCEKLVEAGRRIRKLRIGTSGTKLSDKGIVAICEGCDALEDFSLSEVQGRLSRTLWTKPRNYPSALTRFTIAIAEAGPHHSWTTDHLVSLHAVPMSCLTHLSVIRLVTPPRLINGAPTFDTPVDDVAALHAVPKEFVEGMKGAESLLSLECDWWAWGMDDLKSVLDSCPKLEVLKICLDAPFSKLLAMTSAFATLSSLHKLSVSVSPQCAPGKPPVPLFPLSQPHTLPPTPQDSPVSKAKSALPQLLDFDQMQTQTCVASEVTGDPSMPLMRDIKRFVRKCPKLAELEWCGKAGRGTWRVTRPASSTSKISINVTVEYTPPMISEETLRLMELERDTTDSPKDVASSGDMERVGQSWTGETAERLAAEKLKEDSALQQARARETPRKGSSGHTASGGGDVSSVPMPALGSHSPVQSYTVLPLSPPQSATSVSSMSFPPNDSSSKLLENGTSSTTRRMRTPSEPAASVRSGGGGRSRSATASAGKVSGPNVGAGVSKTKKSGNGNGGQGPSQGQSQGGRGKRDAKKSLNGNTSTSSSGSRGKGRGGASSAFTTPAPGGGRAPRDSSW